MNKFNEVFYDEVDYMMSYAKWTNAMFNIRFNNGYCHDETQYTVEGEKTLQEIRKELYRLWLDFCKENDILPNTIICISYVGRDTYYDEE